MPNSVAKLFWRDKKAGPRLSEFLRLFAQAVFVNGRGLRPAGKELSRSPILLFVVLAYWAILGSLGGLHSDHFILCGFSLFLYYWKLGSRRLLLFLTPMILSGVLYDSMRYYADFLRGAVHVAQPYQMEKFLFGIPSGPGGELQTPNEFWQQHTFAVLDFFCGLAYLVFIFEYFFLCIYFFFTGLWEYLRRAAWTFFWVNFFGYCTYYIYAAAPPWYVALFGIGPARMDTKANPAGAARFDQLMHTHFFTGMYGKSADVFGAIPSLHVSYPFMAMVFSLQMRRFRGFSVFFFLLMCFSAVYLNHHYVIDVLLGISYASITLFLVESYYAGKPLNVDKFY